MSRLSRRNFLKSTANVVAIAFAISNTPYVLAENTPDNSGHVTPCIRFTADGTITLFVPTPEMGQGMSTTGAQLIAEELSLKLSDVHVELMPFVGKYTDQGRATMDRFYQGSGGSGSTMRIWNQMRNTAAYARDLFIEAAARRWQEASINLSIENGHVVNAVTGDTLAYRDIVELARNMTGALIAENSEPKQSKSHNVIGKTIKMCTQSTS